MKKIVLIFGALVAGWFVVIAAWLLFYMNSPVGEGQKEFVFEVEPGIFAQTLNKLVKEGVVKDGFRISLISKLTGYGNQIKVGEYKINSGMTSIELLRHLASGKTLQHPLTIQEGLNMFEVAQVLEANKLGSATQFLKLCKDSNFLKKYLKEAPSSCEGYLFPDTYFFTKNMGIEKIIIQMFKHFNENWDLLQSEFSSHGMDRNQVVTLASIVEKETGAPEERAIVASVYLNRLRIGMRLQADPTVLYGKMVGSGGHEANITKADLSQYTPYNTYVQKGLPIGPIANPGLAAMRAVFSPAQTDFLFFQAEFQCPCLLR